VPYEIHYMSRMLSFVLILKHAVHIAIIGLIKPRQEIKRDIRNEWNIWETLNTALLTKHTLRNLDTASYASF
jgi:hypothetical protein